MPKNAFATLMSHRTKLTPSSNSSLKSEFIACPAGCGQHIRAKDVNAHLDACLSATSTQPSTRPPVRRPVVPFNQFMSKKRRVLCPICSSSFPTSIINLHLDQCVGRKPDDSMGVLLSQMTPESKSVSSPGEEVDDDVDNQPFDTHVATDLPVDASPSVPTADLVESASPHLHSDGDGPVSADSTVNNVHDALTGQPYPVVPPASTRHNSVFAQMMNQSKVRAEREKEDTITTVLQSFHLDESLRLSLHWSRNPEQEWTHPTWSTLVTLKDKTHHGTASSSLNIDVHVSTSIPHGLAGETAPWVRHHSRLSVPVLKSILQKSIRRRRPLPSVRVAMELADKSLVDLLRRLPIICMEDSMLHPDTDFVVWLMMAQAKDFVPPRRLMVRLFQIVFEIASCPWYDSANGKTDHSAPTTLTSLIQTERSSNSTDDSLVWPLLVRAKYGGMKCDVDMLQSAAATWRGRCATPVPDAVSTRWQGTSNPSTLGITWSDVPRLAHQRGKEQGMGRVAALCQDGLDRLTMDDVCVEGVDFHCSRIIDELLADAQLSGICFDLMVLAQDGLAVPDNKTLLLQGLFKKYMWNLSSSINYRIHLLTSQPASSVQKHTDAGMWHELIAPRALAYQKEYVKQRLA